MATYNIINNASLVSLPQDEIRNLAANTGRKSTVNDHINDKAASFSKILVTQAKAEQHSNNSIKDQQNHYTKDDSVKDICPNVIKSADIAPLSDQSFNNNIIFLEVSAKIFTGYSTHHIIDQSVNLAQAAAQSDVIINQPTDENISGLAEPIDWAISSLVALNIQPLPINILPKIDTVDIISDDSALNSQAAADIVQKLPNISDISLAIIDPDTEGFTDAQSAPQSVDTVAIIAAQQYRTFLTSQAQPSSSSITNPVTDPIISTVSSNVSDNKNNSDNGSAATARIIPAINIANHTAEVSISVPAAAAIPTTDSVVDLILAAEPIANYASHSEISYINDTDMNPQPLTMSEHAIVTAFYKYDNINQLTTNPSIAAGSSDLEIDNIIPEQLLFNLPDSLLTMAAKELLIKPVAQEMTTRDTDIVNDSATIDTITAYMPLLLKSAPTFSSEHIIKSANSIEQSPSNSFDIATSISSGNSTINNSLSQHPELAIANVDIADDLADMSADLESEELIADSPANISNFARQLKTDLAHSPARTHITTDNNLASMTENISPAQPIEQISLNIEKLLGQNNSTIKVILQPESLGTVDINIEIIDNDIHKIEIIAERRDTLELLQQESTELHQLIQEVTKSEQPNLSFDFKQDSNNRNKPQSQHTHTTNKTQQSKNIMQSISYFGGYRNESATLNGVNIRV